MIENWKKQRKDDPLFADILWSRPESKSFAGKLAVVGGNSFAIGAPGTAYSAALAAGIGICKVLLPDAVKKNVSGVFPDAEFTVSNRSGSFSKKAENDLLSISAWSDAVLLTGDFGRNSETAMLLEKYVRSYHGLLTVTHDAVDYFKAIPKLLLERPDTLVVLSMAQLQKYFINLPSITPIHFSMSPLQLVNALNEITSKHPASIITKHHDELFLSSNGKVISQPDERKIWRVETATKASVLWLQNPNKQIQSIAASFTI